MQKQKIHNTNIFILYTVLILYSEWFQYESKIFYSDNIKDGIFVA